MYVPLVVSLVLFMVWVSGCLYFSSHPLRSLSRRSFYAFQCIVHFRYATLENKTPAETFPKFPSISRVIDRSDRNPPIIATSVTFWPSLRHGSGLWLVDFDPKCREHVRLTEILETFPRVFCVACGFFLWTSRYNVYVKRNLGGQNSNV